MRKRITKLVLVCLAASLLLTMSCSRKGVHMSKHRKSRKCNCPTFVQQTTDNTDESSLSDFFYISLQNENKSTTNG